MDNQSNNEPSVNITEMWELLEAAIPGPWKQGTSTHRLVGKDNYEVADFHHGHEQVLTAKMFNMMPLLLDELLLLRAKLAENKAAISVLVSTCKCNCDEKEMTAGLTTVEGLAAATRAHMEEDAALRDCAEALRMFDVHAPEWPRFVARRKEVLARLDAVRAKGGG